MPSTSATPLWRMLVAVSSDMVIPGSAIGWCPREHALDPTAPRLDSLSGYPFFTPHGYCDNPHRRQGVDFNSHRGVTIACGVLCNYLRTRRCRNLNFATSRMLSSSSLVTSCNTAMPLGGSISIESNTLKAVILPTQVVARARLRLALATMSSALPVAPRSLCKRGNRLRSFYSELHLVPFSFG